MNHYTFLLLSLFSFQLLAAQEVEVTLEECLQWAENNSPVLATKPLQLEQLTTKTKRLNRSLWPQLSLNGKASWQSDVLSIPLNFPGVEIPSPPAEQYGFSLDVQQTIWDGGVNKAQKEVANSAAQVDILQNDANFHQVKGQIIQLYYGALLAERQEEYLLLLHAEVQRHQQRVHHAVENGVAIESDENQLLAKAIELEQQLQSARYKKNTAIKALELWTGQGFPTGVKLAPTTLTMQQMSIQRPELAVFNSATESITANQQLVQAANRPKLGVFAQFGYGQPGLNMLSAEWDSYTVVGAKLNVPLTWIYSGSQSLDIQQLALQRMQVVLQKDQFILQTETARIAQRQEILQLTSMESTDQKLIDLHNQIRTTTAVQLEQGIITTTDYLTAVNKEELARQNQLLHQIQKMKALATYHWLSGY